ncbi:MAG: YdcF family protein [Candidatus Limivicinus sp.]|nr:YdcF family protein [Candidatus Limivicinus sp.]
MSFIRHLPHWLLADIIILVLAAFFKFAMRGYDYIAYTLVFAMLLITLHHYASDALWRAAVILTSLGLMYFCVVELLIVGSARTDDSPEGKKYLIVLGAAVHGDSPSLALTHRLEGALDYLNRHPDSVAIVSGGRGKGENITEAECMRRWLLNHEVDSGRIICEDKATSTMENLLFSFDIIRSLGDAPDGNVALLSSSYHLYRAKCMAEQLGVKAAGVAGNPGYPVYMLNCFIREAFGVTHLWVFGN